jgi:hypothetical protein
MQPDSSSSGWDEARDFRDEHERLRAAGEHLARAIAELTRAMAAVGDHATAVTLRDSIESLQIMQAQIVSASEKAFSLGQMAARRARHEARRRQVDEATAPGDPPLLPPFDRENL